MYSEIKPISKKQNEYLCVYCVFYLHISASFLYSHVTA